MEHSELKPYSFFKWKKCFFVFFFRRFYLQHVRADVRPVQAIPRRQAEGNAGLPSPGRLHVGTRGAVFFIFHFEELKDGWVLILGERNWDEVVRKSLELLVFKNWSPSVV